MWRPTAHYDASDGFTLVEAVTALAILVLVAVGSLHLVTASVRQNDSVHARTTASLIAFSKMQELQALTWRVDRLEDGTEVRVSDGTSDVSRDPPGAGGQGLRPSPPGSDDTSAAGYVDYLDRGGRVVGNGESPPPNAVFVRRWAVRPAAADAQDTVVLTVVAGRIVDAQTPRRPGQPHQNQVRLVALKARSRSWP